MWRRVRSDAWRACPGVADDRLSNQASAFALRLRSMAPVSAVELVVALLRRERPLDAISKALCWQIVPIQERDCKFFWPLGPRPEDHPGLSRFGF